MKIALLNKLSIVKVYSFLIALSLIASIPSQASASLFSDLGSIFTVTQQAAANETPDIKNDGIIQNSQTITLLSPESSLNPDLKNIDQNQNTVIVQDDSLVSSDGIFSIAPDVQFEKSSLSDQIRVYTVESGDTLSEIADTFDVSMNTIRWENNISGEKISVGQKLNILPVTGVKHIVKSGDTISKIGDKYEADSQDILIFNGILDGDTLKKGDIIFVPNGIIKPVVVVKAKINSGSNNTSSSYSNTKAPSGYYIRPASGPITSPYGSRRGGFHPGVDIGNIRGTPIYSAASGIVVQVINGCIEGVKSCGGRYGNHITIEHSNGTRTRYAHLSKTSVNIGQAVSQGQEIGKMGNTGSSTGSHLHFEVENANGSKMRPPV